MALLCLASCAKQQPLSESQKKLIFDTLESSGDAYNAVIANAATSSSHASSPAALVTLSGKRIDSSKPAFRQMSGVLRDKIKARDCRVRLVAPNSYWTESAQGIKRTFALLRVWGEKYCPINLDFKISTLLEPAIGRWAVSYDYSYQVIDSSYAKLNDVDAIELHGGVSINGMNSSSVRSETDLKGTIHTQSSGTINIASAGKLDGRDPDLLSGETVWKFSYADFEANFHKKYDNGNISYEINDEASSSEDFERYFSLGGDPFLYSSNAELVH
ncbi:MAG: hypothetical protein ACJ763_05515 [Bdellovibrionia bacterium]